MKKYAVIWMLFFALLMIAWCSMVPSDEEIIEGSVLENEIFWNNLDDEIVESIESEDEIINIDTEDKDDNYNEEDADESVEVEIQQLE